jgi:hypothetical protein
MGLARACAVARGLRICCRLNSCRQMMLLVLAAAAAVAAAPARPASVPTRPPPPLAVLRYGASANGFRAPPRGWNPWGLIANSKLAQTQASVLQQCGALKYLQSGASYCSLDSGWSA